MLLQLERGIARRTKRQWRQGRPLCIRASGAGSFAPVGLLPVAPSLGLLAVGLAAACTACAAERIADALADAFAASRWSRYGWNDPRNSGT